MSPLRAPRPEEALLGVVPGAVAEPATVEEAAEVMGACARDRQRVGFVGGGTDLGVGAPPAGLDVLLRTTRLDRVVEHLPADQIVVAEAGLTVAALQRVLLPHGQRLALDPPQPERATLGGVVAANAFGARRTRHGTARDLLVGLSLVRADGVVARGGGKVVKNVAGFDLPRLMVGSLGTLGLVATVTFRLHPLPEASATLLLAGPSPARVRALVTALREAQLEPASVALHVSGAGLSLAVRFEGFGPGVRQQGERLAALARQGGGGCEWLDEAAAAAFWGEDEARRSAGAVRARLAAPPAALQAVVEGAVAPLVAALGGGATLDPTLGVGVVGGAAASPGDAAVALGRARQALGALGGTLVLAAAPAEVRAAFDPWGPPPAALAVMRRLKARLDPDGRLAPGRFVGGL